MSSEGAHKQRSRGDKRSSWATFRRRLILVRRLLRGPATVADLIAAAEAEQGGDAYPLAAELAMKHDLQSLRDEFGCGIKYHRGQQAYVLEELGELALLDLPDEGLEALALLDATFPDDAPVGGNDQIRQLIGQIYALLPEARRDMLGRHFALPRITWAAAYAEDVDTRIVSTIQRALQLRHQIRFDYHSNYDADDQPHRYTVAPYLLYFRDGHTYLDSTVLKAPPEFAKLSLRAIQFRLDRIIPRSLRMLPDEIPDERPAQPVYTVMYILAAAVARNRDVAHWFPNTTVEYRDDGSALICAQVTNLWQARQILMRYIENCQVLEPPELVVLMRQSAERLATLYARPKF